MTAAPAPLPPDAPGTAPLPAERVCARCKSPDCFGTLDNHWECHRCGLTWIEHPFDKALANIFSINANQEPITLVQTATLVAANHDLLESANRTVALNDQLLEDRAKLREEIRKIKLGVLTILTDALAQCEAQYANPEVKERSYFMGKRAAIMAIIAEVSVLYWPHSQSK